MIFQKILAPYIVNQMKRLWTILTFIILIQSDTFISNDEQRNNWFNSLVEGTYADGDNSTIIKKNYNGNIIIQSIAGTSFCSMEYDSTGSFVSSWSGVILASK
jgi:hypothetical protein